MCANRTGAAVTPAVSPPGRDLDEVTRARSHQSFSRMHTLCFGKVVESVQICLQAVTGLRGPQLVLGTAAGAATALLLDGTALTCFPSWYGGKDTNDLGMPAAWLLWGAGWVLVYALKVGNKKF